MKKLFLLLIAVSLLSLIWGQTNPTAQTLPFSLTSQSGSTLPAGIAIHRFGTSAGAIPTTRTLSPGNADLPYNSAYNSGGWRDEVVSGIGILASGSQSAGAMILAINTTGKTSIQVSWKCSTILQQTFYDCSIALQYRIGITGNFTDVGTSTTYTSAGKTAGDVSTLLSETLPAGAENQAVVQVRWIYWQSAGVSGSRDRISVDDVNITGTTAATPSISPSVSTIPFSNVKINTTSELNFSVTAANLTPASGNITVSTSSTGYQVSLSSGTGFSGSVDVPYFSGGVTAYPVYVKFSPTSVTSYPGTISLSGGTASASVTLSGTGMNVPSVDTPSSGSVTYQSATLGGNVTNFNNSNGTERGIYYSTSPIADGEGTKVFATGTYSTTGAFTIGVSGLSANTPYYYKAYMKNAAGEGYSSQGIFTTLIAPPGSTTCNPAVSITNSSFRATWNAVSNSTYLVDVAQGTEFTSGGTNVTLAQWTFPNNPDDQYADAGIDANYSASVLSNSAVISTTSSGTISYAQVGLTTNCDFNTGWDSGSGTKYWQIVINTVGYQNLKISSVQKSSNTGPKDFKLQYKIGANGTLGDVTGGTITVGNDWTTGVVSNLSLPPACNNQTTVYIQWIMNTNNAVNGTLGSAGTSRIDDILIVGDSNNPGNTLSSYNNHPASSNYLDITGLSPSTAYCYRVKATNVSGTSANSDVMTVTTTANQQTTESYTTNGNPVTLPGAVDNGVTIGMTVDPSSGSATGTITLRISQIPFTTPVPDASHLGRYINLFSDSSLLAGTYVVTFSGISPTELWQLNGTTWSRIDTADFSTPGQVSFSLSATKANVDRYLALNDGEGTLPVELSSFTAIVTPQNYVRLDWITQSETGVSGYYLYRNSISNLNGAQVVSPLITASNTSQEQSYSFTDSEVMPGTYYYWLQNMDMDGQFDFHGPIYVTLNDDNGNTTPIIPLLTSLQSIYPNPFNPTATISFGLAKAEQVNIQIYNIRGEKVRSFLSGAMNSGTYRRTWDGTDDNGRTLTSGVYYIKMTAGKYSSVQKAILMK